MDLKVYLCTALASWRRLQTVTAVIVITGAWRLVARSGTTHHAELLREINCGGLKLRLGNWLRENHPKKVTFNHFADLESWKKSAVN